MESHRKRIVIAMGCSALALFAASWLIVRGIAIDFDEIGVPIGAVPDEAFELYWLRIGGEGEPRLSADSPLRLLWRVYESSEPPDPALRLAMVAAIPEVPRRADASRRLWRLRFGASIAWLSRHWTAAQAITAILGRAHYGHRFVGLEAAALGYYGRKPAELTRAELASLVVTASRVVKFNPWCHPDANAEAVSLLLAGVEPAIGESLDPLARLRPVPEGTCPKR